MHLYNLASGIVLILPIINIALAAPVQVQENSRASANVVHAPRDVITVLGKRVVEEEIEKAAAFFEKSDTSVGSSDAHVSSSSKSGPPGPDHVDAQPPPPNLGPESSTANPDHGPKEPSSPSSTASKPLSFDEKINQAWAEHYDRYIKNGPNRASTPLPDSASFDDRITAAWDKHYDVLSKEGSGTPHAPAPNSELSTANPDHGSGVPSSPSAVPKPGSFDDRIDKGWAQRYSDFLKDSPNKQNF